MPTAATCTRLALRPIWLRCKAKTPRIAPFAQNRGGAKPAKQQFCAEKYG
jgi:hypothetical protein